MHAWHTCIHSSIMQTSPGHMLSIACVFTTIISHSDDCLMGHRQSGPLLIKHTNETTAALKKAPCYTTLTDGTV